MSQNFSGWHPPATVTKYPALQIEQTPLSILHEEIPQFASQVFMGMQAPAAVKMYPSVQFRQSPVRALQDDPTFEQ